LTIVAQIQNLRFFVTAQLGDVIDWNKHIEPDPVRTTTGDIAYVQIKTAYNTYKMAMGSAYAEPPAGAPSVCRSLGWVTFQHVGEDKYLLNPKNDLAYQDISKHIHERELTDALAACRRELAEAKDADEAQLIRIRMKEIAVKAERWGIKAHVPEAPQAPKIADIGALPLHRNVPIRTVESPIDAQGGGHAYGLAPFVGAPIIYYCADRIAGMEQVPGILIRIQRDGRAALQLFADLNEIQFKDNIVRRGSDAGNGRVHTSNCWDFNPEWLEEQARIRSLEDVVDRLRREAMDRITKLEGAVISLEAKPKRGRPPKPEGGESEGGELASELEPAV
jgi:hypothetical protein